MPTSAVLFLPRFRALESEIHVETARIRDTRLTPSNQPTIQVKQVVCAAPHEIIFFRKVGFGVVKVWSARVDGDAAKQCAFKGPEILSLVKRAITEILHPAFDFGVCDVLH